MTVYDYGKFQSGNGWITPTIFYSPYDLNEIIIRVKTGAATITIDDIVEFVAGGAAASDLITATYAADESKTFAAIVLNNEWNRNQLAIDNSVDTYHGLTKGTATFASGTYIDVALLMPGMIINTKVANSQTIAPFTNVACGGAGKVKLFDDSTPDDPSARVGKFLSVVTSVAALQYAAVLVK